MSSVKTDVNPSDIGTKALGCLAWTQSSSRRVHLATGTMETSDQDELQAERMVKRTSRMIDTCEQA